ncbi:MAG: DUF493 domain-containing protein [Candidatus Anaerobiospirillum pullicola]|uniref:DUF493 domain-containing protein n=1 Tax=Candidatus Anaerobiospirillum pullicola TaxID=2838451 RepID=A0A948TGI5_9GAMM|nr:DUF493 domain-containing protein [Candidatus Anaerobiospirillum pullicola]
MPLQYKFNEVLDFPCDQHLRIIVLTEDSQPQRLIDNINELMPESTDVDSIIDSKLSANGKYTSYNLRVRFQSAEQMEMLYRELPKQDFVKHLL